MAIPMMSPTVRTVSCPPPYASLLSREEEEAVSKPEALLEYALLCSSVVNSPARSKQAKRVKRLARELEK